MALTNCRRASRHQLLEDCSLTVCSLPATLVPYGSGTHWSRAERATELAQVGRALWSRRTRTDVVHSFGLPQMRIKQDAIPGLVQPVWFTPTRMGQWEIACSQLCGLGHYRMRGFYSVQSPSDFDDWMAQETAALAIP